MIDMGRRQGNFGAEVMIYPDAVCVHSNIVQVSENLYEYDCVMFEPKEYSEFILKMNLPKINAKARADIDYIAMETGVDIDE